MKLYTFDLMLKVSITVGGESEDEARRFVEEPLAERAYLVVFEDDEEVRIAKEAATYDLEGEATIQGSATLVQIDGIDVA